MSISDLKILNLEDNPVDAELIREKMISEGFDNLQIEVVSTEKEFMNRLNTNSYNLILSDYNLPQFNGLEALLMAKKARPEIPFIFVSGTGEYFVFRCRFGGQHIRSHSGDEISFVIEMLKCFRIG